MKRKIISKVGMVGALAASVGMAFIAAPLSYATSIFDGVHAAQGEGQPSDLFGAAGIFTTATNLLLYVVGLLSVVMIIVGGLRYVISGGNSTAVTAAKNTVLYAIVGLVVAFLAYAVINFVLGALVSGTGSFTNV